MILPFTIPTGIAPGPGCSRPLCLLPVLPGPPAPISLYVQHQLGLAGPAAHRLRNRNVQPVTARLPGGRGQGYSFWRYGGLYRPQADGHRGNAVYAGPGMQARQGSKRRAPQQRPPCCP